MAKTTCRDSPTRPSKPSEICNVLRKVRRHRNMSQGQWQEGNPCYLTGLVQSMWESIQCPIALSSTVTTCYLRVHTNWGRSYVCCATKTRLSCDSLSHTPRKVGTYRKKWAIISHGRKNNFEVLDSLRPAAMAFGALNPASNHERSIDDIYWARQWRFWERKT